MICITTFTKSLTLVYLNVQLCIYLPVGRPEFSHLSGQPNITEVWGEQVRANLNLRSS